LVKAIRHASNKAHVLVHHVLLTDPNLKNICSKVVAELDSEVLEPQRVIQQYIQKIIQQHKKISD
jgi:hypothetical protein